jgi:hypothetical protein
MCPTAQLDGVSQETSTAVAWVPKTPLSFDEWCRVGRQLATIDKALRWWIGDWLNYGERAYGKEHTEALEATGYDVSSLHNMAWVAGSFDPSRRRATLSWSHHQEVAGLEPPEQDLWLERADEGRWSRRRLRSELRLSQRLTIPAREDEPKPRSRGGRRLQRNRSRSSANRSVTVAFVHRGDRPEVVEKATSKLCDAAIKLGFELAGKPLVRE